MFNIGGRPTSSLRAPEETLPGRREPLFDVPPRHEVLGTPVAAEPGSDGVPPALEVAIFGLGCFWGAEEIYWQLPGVWSTSVGYAGGTTPHPTYEEVCTGETNHTEAVRVVFDPTTISYPALVKTFFEVHDPTQGMRQGNDLGTQYRSAIYWTTPEQREIALSMTKVYAAELSRRGRGEITTEIRPAAEASYWYAEPNHQQYLAKNPLGYRCHANTGVPYPG